MVDWSLARQIARFAAGGGGGASEPAARSTELEALVGDAEGHLREYTGLSLADPIPPAEPVSRAEWADVNLDSLAALLEPVSTRLSERLGTSGPFAKSLMTAGKDLAV